MQYDPLEIALALEQYGQQRYSKGGKVVDFLAEVLKGGSKPTDTKRRAAMGLPKDLTPKPGEVVVKEEVKTAPKKGETSVSMTEAMNIPMSRRDVLRAGAGQAMSAMAPRGAMGALMKAAGSPAELMKQAVTAPTAGAGQAMTIPGAIAKAISMGLDEDQTIDMLKRLDLADEMDVIHTLPIMRNPIDFQVNIGDEFELMGPREALSQMIGTDSGLDIRQSLREISRENPKLYDQLKKVARDISDLSMEP
jgi:hypothetical protein